MAVKAAYIVATVIRSFSRLPHPKISPERTTLSTTDSTHHQLARLDPAWPPSEPLFPQPDFALQYVKQTMRIQPGHGPTARFHANQPRKFRLATPHENTRARAAHTTTKSTDVLGRPEYGPDPGRPQDRLVFRPRQRQQHEDNECQQLQGPRGATTANVPLRGGRGGR